MIEVNTGDMFKSGAEALVNPVNCVGVMGGGLAAVFKKKFPYSYDLYRYVCDNGFLVPGSLYITRDRLNKQDIFIIHFPTKLHYVNDSEMSYVSNGLDMLAEDIETFKIKSIAIPALGCGLGNLDWSEVEPLIREKLGHLKDVRILLYPPK